MWDVTSTAAAAAYCQGPWFATTSHAPPVVAERHHAALQVAHLDGHLHLRLVRVAVVAAEHVRARVRRTLA